MSDEQVLDTLGFDVRLRHALDATNAGPSPAMDPGADAGISAGLDPARDVGAEPGARADPTLDADIAASPGPATAVGRPVDFEGFAIAPPPGSDDFKPKPSHADKLAAILARLVIPTAFGGTFLNFSRGYYLAKREPQNALESDAFAILAQSPTNSG